VTDVSRTDNHDHRSDRKVNGAVIYVIGTGDEQHVKIGKTRQDVGARRRQHEGRGPGRQEYHFLAGVLGGDSDEKAVHRHFRHHLMPDEKEWFHAAEPIVSWVRWLRQQWFVASTEAECSALPRESADRWLPAPERITPPPQRLAFGPWGSLEAPEITGDDYYTDQRIIAAAREAMGGIDLDPASHPVANRIVQARTIYTHSTDGLAQEWAGRVWCNPPFGLWETWAARINHEWASGRIDEMCVLIATRSLTALSVAPMLAASAALCILRGRIPFWGPKATSSPDDGHAIVYFGEHAHRFIRAFAPLGTVFTGLSEVPA